MKYRLHKNFHIVIPKKDVERLILSGLKYANVRVEKDSKIEEFIIKLLRRPHGPIEVVMPKFVRKELSIKIGDSFEIIDIRPIITPRKPDKLIANNTVDLLFLIPSKMNNGKEIIIDSVNNWLKLWSLKCNEIKLKRFIPIDVLGKLFGLMQAESAKSGNKFDFSNILISEHKKFVELFENFGINPEWKCYVQFSPKICKKEKDKIINEFSKNTNIPITNIIPVKDRDITGSPIFEICVYSKLFNEIFLGILSNLRNYLANKQLNGGEKKLAESFIAKLLTGDGSIILSKNNSHNTPRIIISEDLPYQEDDKKILQNIGIKASIDSKNFEIRLSSNWFVCKYLCEIKAFEGHLINREKLVKPFLKNRKTRNLIRLKLFKNRILTPKEFRKIINIKRESSIQWFTKRLQEGYLEKHDRIRGGYLLTEKGKNFIRFIENLEDELEKLEVMYNDKSF